MMIRFYYIGLFSLLCFSACQQESSTTSASGPGQDSMAAAAEISAPIQTIPRRPVRYEFDRLGIELGVKYYDAPADSFWRWDYMGSPNNGPDSLGREHYMNINRPPFFYNEEETQPAIFIETERNRIVSFSAVVIFMVPDSSDETIADLLDRLVMFDVLREDSVRAAVLDGRVWSYEDDVVRESIKLQLAGEEFVYDRIRYTVRLKESDG